MLALGMISPDEFNRAKAERVAVTDGAGGRFGSHAEYVAELARQLAYERFGDAAYTRGINVYTTVSSVRQTLAYDAVQAGLQGYARRHGGKGPAPQAALVSLDARTGAIEAMVGGSDFTVSRFNHATQAQRQPGSTFKPFIYSAALERGVSPATLINDAPLDTASGWQPGNDDGRFLGPITVRRALAESRNLPAIRTLQTIGIPYAVDYAGKFGFSPTRLPRYLPLALGTGETTPLRLAAAYAVFANTGFRVEPYLIARITDGDGKVLFAADRDQPAPQRVIPARNAFVMDSLLHSVVDSGTGNAVRRYLRRGDVAGKTGTTNDAMDGWFAGYAADIATVAWMGFDDNRSQATTSSAPPRRCRSGPPTWRPPGLPESAPPAPSDVVRNGGDWIYAENADGSHGVAAIGLPPPQPDASGDGAGAAAADAEAQSAGTAGQQMMPAAVPPAAAARRQQRPSSPGRKRTPVGGTQPPPHEREQEARARGHDMADSSSSIAMIWGVAALATVGCCCAVPPARGVLGHGRCRRAVPHRPAGAAGRGRRRGQRLGCLPVHGRHDADRRTGAQDRPVRPRRGTRRVPRAARRAACSCWSMASAPRSPPSCRTTPPPSC